MVTDIINLINNKTVDLNNFMFDSKLLNQKIKNYIECLCCQKITELNSHELNVNKPLTIKSIENIEIKSNDENYKIVIKSHDINKYFSMPNLISIEKARKYLKISTNHIIYLFKD
jgi:hypothetical protein